LDSWSENKPQRPESLGFTLIELVLVVAVLGVLAAIAMPSVSGYLSSSKSRAFETDKRTLQAAVDAWRTDVVNRTSAAWPTVGGIQGALADGSANGVDIGTDSTAVKISTLATAGYISGADGVKSVAYSTSPSSGTGATNSPVGSYVWYVDSNGLVQGRYWIESDVNVGRIDLAELAAADGFASGVYP